MIDIDIFKGILKLTIWRKVTHFSMSQWI